MLMINVCALAFHTAYGAKNDDIVWLAGIYCEMLEKTGKRVVVALSMPFRPDTVIRVTVLGVG